MPTTTTTATSSSLTALRVQWTELYTKTLPHLALTRAAAQPVWPVHLDHCFARIIYDTVIGDSTYPWPSRLKSPAVKNMSEEQLQKCIDMGDAIAAGTINLVEADERSLEVRGKVKGGGKRKRAGDGEGQLPLPAQKKTVKKQGDIRTAMQSTPATRLPTPPRSASPPTSPPTNTSTQTTPPDPSSNPSTPTLQHLIHTSHLPPTRQRVLLALLQVPRGRVTTYGALASFLHTSARAVGSAMRNNPFAPAVPCHRVVAAGGKVGGFGGEGGEGVGRGSRVGVEEGAKVGEKRRLLREEGVRFDGRGRVVGGVWEGFVLEGAAIAVDFPY